MQILSIRFRSPKPTEEIAAMAVGSLPKFEKPPGLIQKYYVDCSDSDEMGGIYVWESSEHLQAYLAGPIVAAMPERYAMPAPPRLEILDLDFEVQLTAERPPRAGQVISSVRLASGLHPEALKEKRQELVSHNTASPGLVHTYVVSNPGSGRAGGLYVWESEQDLNASLAEPELKYIREQFESAGPIEIETLRINRILRS